MRFKLQSLKQKIARNTRLAYMLIKQSRDQRIDFKYARLSYHSALFSILIPSNSSKLHALENAKLLKDILLALSVGFLFDRTKPSACTSSTQFKL